VPIAFKPCQWQYELRPALSLMLLRHANLACVTYAGVDNQCMQTLML